MSNSERPARASVIIRLSVFSPLARKISPLIKRYCFSKSSSSGFDSVTLVEVYQISLPSFLAPSTSLARSSVWLQTETVLNEKHRAQELNNATTFETELIALPSVPQISSGYKAR